LEWAEVALEHVPVVGVHDDRARPPSEDSGQASEHARLGCVGVNYVGSVRANSAHQPYEGAEVVAGT